MKLEVYSYRFAQEVLEHENYRAAWDELRGVIERAPVFVWPGKSAKHPRLEVVQQVMNTYFDRRLAVDLGWEYHPLATQIVGSGLRADFRKRFNDLGIQVEVQFGNMARWYSDIFKFQAGYSAGAIQIGVSIIPVGSLARLIDQNIVNFERAKRELPSAELSITLPIVMIGLERDTFTQIVDLRETQFKKVNDIIGRGKEANRWRVVHGFLSNIPMSQIGPTSETGPMLAGAAAEDEDDTTSAEE